MALHDIWLLFAAVLISIVLPLIQERRLKESGSDHFLHLFMIDAMKQNGHKLLTRVPRILNESYCGYPIFLHWVLSFCSSRQITVVARWINPVASALLVLLAYGVLRADPHLASHAGTVSMAIALLPQAFHALNARNYGLSVRPAGILFATLFLLFSAPHGLFADASFSWMGAIAVGYLIWGTSIFAQQSIVLIALGFGAVFGDWSIIAKVLGSLIAFVILHPRYASSYLKYKYIHSKNYALHTAKNGILRQRESVWQDLFKDIWLRLIKNPARGLVYAYGNPVLIVIFLNPLGVLAPFAAPSEAHHTAYLHYCFQLSAIALLVFLLTSLRPLRFLGEPERYVETGVLFSSTAGILFVGHVAGAFGVAAVLAYCGILVMMQLLVSARVQSISPQSEVENLGKLIRAEMATDEIRFSSNSQDLTKRLLNVDWNFAYPWHTSSSYADFPVDRVFAPVPFIRREVFEDALERYRINVCLLDKRHFATIWENRHAPAKKALLADRGGYALYRIWWDSAIQPDKASMAPTGSVATVSGKANP